MPDTHTNFRPGSQFHTPLATARRGLKKAQTAVDRLDADYARRRGAAFQRIERWAAEVERIEAEMRDGAA